MFRNLSHAYHCFRKAGLSPSEAMESAKQYMEGSRALFEEHSARMRQKSERKYAPWEMNELKRQYSGMGEANQQSYGHFFQPDTMRFFKSRIKDRVYGGNMFITSERGPSGPRVFTVRKITKAGHIKTHGDFQKYATAAAAERAIARIMDSYKRSAIKAHGKSR